MRVGAELVVTLLWGLAIAATAALVDPSVFTYLGPLYATCMIGSGVTVRQAKRP